MPEETKMQTEVLNDVAEEIKKISNVVTDGLIKIKDNSENTNFEIKNLSSAMSNVKETVNNISLTTDNQNEIQQTQIESLNLLIQETETSKDEIKSSIEKQSKNQSELFKKQTDEIKKSNIQLKEQNKGFKKLTKSIDDLDVGGKGGSGGGLLSLLSSGLGGIVSSVMGAVVGTVGSFLKPLLVAMAAAGAGSLIYKFFIEPYLDEMNKKAQKALGLEETAGEQIKGSTGEKMFAEVDEKGEATGKVLTESEVKQKISSIDTPEKKQEEERKYIPLSTSVTSTGEARQSVSSTIVDPSLQGASKEELEKAIQEKKAQALPDMTFKAESKEDQDKQRNFYNKKFEQEIIDFDTTFRTRLQSLRDLRETGMDEGLIKWNSGGQEQFEQAAKTGAQQLFTQHLSIIKRIKKAVADGFITQEDADKLQNNISPKLFKSGWEPSQSDTPELANLGLNINYPLPSDSFYSKPGYRLFSVNQSGVVWADTPKIAQQNMLEIIGEPAKPLEQQTKQDNKPKAKTGAILTGPTKGYDVELHGTEAVINPKSPEGDEVTGAIAKNLIKEISDIKSLPRESMMLQDGLNRSKAEYFDMTKAQPLASQAQGGTSIVNNILGGSSSDRSDPNTQFNPYMLSMNNPDNLAKEVLYEIKKAELL